MTASREREAARRVDAKLRERFPNRPLLVGQAPGPGSDGWPCFFGGKSGSRLSVLAGYGSWLGLVRATERRNLLDRFPGKSGKGDAFPMDAARASASSVLPALRGRRAIFVGGKVGQAFGLEEGWLQALRVDLGDPELRSLKGVTGVRVPPSSYRDGSPLDPTGTRFAIVAKFPHPSGISRYWNNMADATRATDFLRAAIGPIEED